MENKPQNRNYITVAITFTAAVTAVLIIISLIPAFEIGDVKFKRANIVSDLFHPELLSDSTGADSVTLPDYDEKLYAENLKNIQSFENVDGMNMTGKSTVWDLSAPAHSTDAGGAGDATAELSSDDVVSIEDFSESRNGLARFFNALKNKEKLNRPVRIAFLGDSFIEGDIMTVDVRERLQDLYGGGGVGFMPMASQVAAMRVSIKHQATGIKTATLLNIKKADSTLKSHYPIGGNIFIPKEGAEVKFAGVGAKRHIRGCSTARLIFSNSENTSVKVVVNGAQENIFTPKSGTNLQQIIVNGDIKSISYSFTNVNGFKCYGAYLENERGISVDNYSLRGSSGIQILASNSRVNRELDALSKVDLIVLQYGLNVVSEKVKSYGHYTKRMVKVVEYVKKCFPDAAILIMGIPDRNMRVEGEFKTLPTVDAMLAAQREVAVKTGSMFWNTFDAMGGHNSMSKFVGKGWGAKDYTHISYQGGRFIARAFVDALIYEKKKTDSNITRTEPQKTDSLGGYNSSSEHAID